MQTILNIIDNLFFFPAKFIMFLFSIYLIIQTYKQVGKIETINMMHNGVLLSEIMKFLEQQKENHSNEIRVFCLIFWVFIFKSI